MILAAVTAHAQQYTFQYYGVEQGLTDLAVRALFQDQRGFLWLGTEGGIFRYDGTRFQSFGPADGIPVSNAAMFGEAPDGSLLVGGQFGLYRQTAPERFEQLTMPGAKTVNWGSGIQRGSSGRTWIATDAGLMIMTAPAAGGRFRFQLADTPPHSGGNEAAGVFVDRETVWWGCGNQLCAAANGKTQVFGPADGLPASFWRGIRRAGNGDLWVQSRSGQVVVMRSGEARFHASDLPPSRFGPRGLFTVDRWGNLLAPVADGVALQERGQWRFVGHNSGLHGPVYSVLQDREGSLWIGLGGHGLVRWLGYRQWEYFAPESGLAGELVYQVLPNDDGTLWVGTDSGLFYGSKSGMEWRWRREPHLEDIPIHSIRRDKLGRLWLGTESRGAALLDPSSHSLQWFDKRRGLTAASPYMLLIDRRNRIWAGTLTGLYVANLNRMQFRAVADLPPVICLALAESSDGTIWVGSAQGLFRFADGHWRRFTTKDGLSHDEVLSLAADGQGAIWVGYQFGREIDRVQPKGSGLTVSLEGGQFRMPGVTYFLGFDARKRLWAGTNQGVFIKEANHWLHYDHNDGLVWDDCNLNGLSPLSDGTVWVGTSGGLAHFTPREEIRWRDPPVAIFTKLSLGGNDVTPGISVKRSADSLVVRYSSLSFASQNRTLFRYRLIPLFSDWRETPERELQFPGMSPGSYRLEVEARDGWGRWSAKPVVFSFEVRPPWWQSVWAMSILIAGAIGFVTLVIRWRGMAARQRERRLVSLVDERTAELTTANSSLQETTLKLREANQYLVRLSTLDGLTGIANRRMFDQTLEAEWENAQRTGEPLSIILADIDHFKKLNDSAGHQAGDECLKLIAAALARPLKRQSDLVARFGGEEFGVILPSTGRAQAVHVAESMRRSVADLKIGNQDSPAGPIATISLGIATRTEGCFPAPEALLGAADEALYCAKQRGRNRVEFYDPGRISSAQPGSSEIPITS